MKKRANARKTGRREAGRKPRPIPAVLIIVGALGLALLFWLTRPTRPPNEVAAHSPPSQTAHVPATAAAPPAAEQFRRLMGRWLRPDGGYILELRNVDDAGKLEAGYFNPNPIHIARAEASRAGAITKVFVEFQDVNYPGSTYTLTYDPETDQLAGNYFQALLRQNFDVTFVRQR